MKKTKASRKSSVRRFSFISVAGIIFSLMVRTHCEDWKTFFWFVFKIPTMSFDARPERTKHFTRVHFLFLWDEAVGQKGDKNTIIIIALIIISRL